MRNLEMADAIREFVNTHKERMAVFAIRFEQIYDKERSLADCNLAQGDYDNLVRDAMCWRASEQPLRVALQAFCNAFTNNGKTSSLRDWNYRMKEAYDKAVLALGGYSEPLPTPKVIVDEKIFNQAHGLRDGWTQIHANSEFMAPPEESSVDGPKDP